MQVNRCANCMEETGGYPCPHCGFDVNAQPQPGYALPWNTILHGKFLVGKVLGQGGFGITYVGWDLALEVKVAIKEYYPAGQVVRQSIMGSKLQWSGTAQSETARRAGMESFLKEARKMARVDRVPQVVRVRDMFHENDTAYIVMDFVEGETLQARLEREGPLPFDQAMDVFKPALTAMEEVHKAGLIHRDLSPDNIMLEPEGGVRILDLGAAKDLAINQGASSMLVTKGGFSPLEQYGQRGGSGPWTDVYAMAATIYYTLTGILPPNAIDRLDDDELRWDLPDLDTMGVPAKQALQKALAVSAKNRTQTMAELLAELEQAKPKPEPEPAPEPKPEPVPELQQGSKPKPQLEQKPEPAHTPRPKPMARKKLLGIACICAAVLVVIAVWVIRQPENVIASGAAGPSVTWMLDDAGVMTISGSGKIYGYAWDGHADEIISVVVKFGVTEIGDHAFRDCSSLTSVTIPNSVTKIGNVAFYSCSSLTSVTIPNSVTEIGDVAFRDCSSLTSVNIPNSVTEIGDAAFHGCSSLTSVTIPNSVTEIGRGAFCNCSSLTSVTIPNSVTEIDIYAFENCTSLTNVTLPESVTKIGQGTFEYCTSLTSVTIPTSVTKIGPYAFEDCTSLTNVYYGGTEEQWRSIEIEIGGYNDNLLNATIHYNS